MTPKKGQYYYIPRGCVYAIYQCIDERNGDYSGLPQGESFHSREDARRRVYELNGWTYKPR